MVKRDTEEKQKKHKRIRRPSVKGQPRADSTAIPAGVQHLLDQMRENIRKCVPESTCCALIGLDFTVWDDYCVRYPALRLEVKRERAAKLVELQATVEAGAQGWQAAATMLERIDGMNWARSAQGRPANQRSPYSAAMQSRKGKK